MTGPVPARGPLFIVGCDKAGTTLVHSLFDGHPDVVALPVELQLLRVTDVPTAFPGRRRGLASIEDPSAMARALLHARIPLSRLLGRPPSRDIPALDRAAMRHFARALVDTHGVAGIADFFVHVHRTYLAAIGQDPDLASRRLIVEKTPLQEEHALRLRRWFPAARFLHVVRNPYANLHALRLQAAKRKLLVVRAKVESLQLSHVFGALNAEEIAHYRFVRYEDVVHQPERTMRALAGFAGLDFHATMLRPTKAGLPWTGNSMADTPFAGIDPRPVDRWRADISNYELALVGKRLAWARDRFGYGEHRPRGRLAPYLPLRGEDPFSWMLNRWMLHEYRGGPHGPARWRETQPASCWSSATDHAT